MLADIQQALGHLLDRLDAERGPLDTPEDEAEITRYMNLLGGPRLSAMQIVALPWIGLR